MEPLSIHRRVDLDVAVDDLWALIADADGLAQWLGEGVELDIRPGGLGTVIDDGVVRVAHVDRLEERRAIGFTWWEQDRPDAPSRVELEIEARPEGGTRLHIIETLAAETLAAGTLAVEAADRALRWEARVCALWACTVVAALVP